MRTAEGEERLLDFEEMADLRNARGQPSVVAAWLQGFLGHIEQKLATLPPGMAPTTCGWSITLLNACERFVICCQVWGTIGR